jgi:hypothetical protein
VEGVFRRPLGPAGRTECRRPRVRQFAKAEGVPVYTSVRELMETGKPRPRLFRP